jgi:hypothetical protein
VRRSDTCRLRQNKKYLLFVSILSMGMICRAEERGVDQAIEVNNDISLIIFGNVVACNFIFVAM